MKEITMYRTYSYGGMEGRDRECRMFETVELAKEDAYTDNWNDGFTLYKVVLTFNGVITEKEEYMGKLHNKDDEKEYAEEVEWTQDIIAKAKQRIEEHNANAKIKEETRAKRIAEENRMIEIQQRHLDRLQKEKEEGFV